MRILFDKQGNGIDELCEILGFLYKSNNFQNIKSEVRLASKEVKDLLGPSLYELAADFYHNDSVPDGMEPEKLQELVLMIQTCVALEAYLMHAPTRDTIHDENGRGIHSDEHRKVPFEWMLDREEKALAKRLGKEKDMLLDYAVTFDAFQSTPNAVMRSKLLLSTPQAFNAVFPIAESHYTFFHLVPFMVSIQVEQIKPRVGGDALAGIKEESKTGFFTGNNEVIHSASCQALALLTMAMAVERLPFQVLPEGMIENYVGDRITTRANKHAVNEVRIQVRNALRSSGELELLKLEKRAQAAPIGNDYNTTDKFFTT
jgi:hypothetical protein